MSKKKSQLIFIIGILLAVVLIIFVSKDRAENHPKIIISEICAGNSTAAYDDNGDYGADYIELYNCSDVDINLAGYGLSDNSKKLSKFVFPDILIPAGQCIIVWCSANGDDSLAYREDYVPVDLHCSEFRLSNGEMCILTDMSGAVVSSVAVSEDLPKNMSLAISKNNMLEYKVSDPSPYYVEDEVNNAEIATISEPSFSISGGWYTEGFELELFSDEGEIYYTLDGSDPDENSTKYCGAIEINNRSEEPNIYSAIDGISSENGWLPDYPVDKCTVVKAVAISENGSSRITSETYFVGLDEEDYEGISLISLSVSPEDFFGYDNGIYVFGRVRELFEKKYDLSTYSGDSTAFYNYSKKGRGWERKVNLEFFSSDHEKVYEKTAGIRIHGGWTRQQNQKNFQIYAREEYDGAASFDYDFFENGNVYDKLMLRAGGSTDTFVTKIRDVFCQSLVENRDVGTQRAIPCAVFLNGEYWGLYNLQETIGTSYIEEYYGVKADNTIIIKNGETRTDNPEDVALYDEMVSFVSRNDMSIEENYRKVEQMIDIQSLIDYYSIEIYLGNCDTIKNNYAVWRSRNYGDGEYEDCKWRWLLFDLDDTCNMNIGCNTPDIDSFVMGNYYDVNPLDGDELFSSLMKNDEFKERFISSFTEIAETNFNYETVSEKLWKMASVYWNATVKSNNRFRGDVWLEEYPLNEEYEAPYDDDDYGQDIGLIDAFFRERAGYIINYMYEDLGITN